MTRINLTELLIITFVLIGDWYQTQGGEYLEGKPGAKPESSGSEVITLSLAMNFVPFPIKTLFLAFLRTNYLISTSRIGSNLTVG